MKTKNIFSKVMSHTRQLLLRVVSRVRTFLPEPKYKPARYWRSRHRKYGFNLRGVGNCTLSHEQNEKIYSKARETFYELCKSLAIDFKSAHVLEIGCGTGIFTQALLEFGTKDILAIDIADTLFSELQRKFPVVNFQKLDITDSTLDGIYDVIVMIDVTQHIVEHDAFTFAMQNIYSHLDEGGVFIVTSWLSDEFTKRQHYEVQRPLGYYEKEFSGCEFSAPVIFRDKYIFSIRRRSK